MNTSIKSTNYLQCKMRQMLCKTEVTSLLYIMNLFKGLSDQIECRISIYPTPPFKVSQACLKCTPLTPCARWLAWLPHCHRGPQLGVQSTLKENCFCQMHTLSNAHIEARGGLASCQVPKDWLLVFHMLATEPLSRKALNRNIGQYAYSALVFATLSNCKFPGKI